MTPQRLVGALSVLLFALLFTPRMCAQTSGSAETPIDRLRREIASLKQTGCNPATSAIVRDEFGKLIVTRQTQLSLLLEQQIAEVEAAPQSAGIVLTAEDKRTIADLIGPLQAELAVLQSDRPVCDASSDDPPPAVRESSGVKNQSPMMTMAPAPGDTATPAADPRPVHPSAASNLASDPAPAPSDPREPVVPSTVSASSSPTSVKDPQGAAPATNPSAPTEPGAPADAGAGGRTQPAATAASTADPCATTSVAYFPNPPVTTAPKVLSGCAGNAAGVRVIVYARNAISQCPTLDVTQTASPKGALYDLRGNVNPKTGVFYVELAQAQTSGGKPVTVTDGELFCPYAVSSAQNPPVVATLWHYNESDSPLGRTRYYISTGVELSEDNQQFSNQNLYLGLTLDRNWLRGKPDGDHKATALFNSEFSAQLTSIPVAASSTTTTTTASGGTTTPTPSVGTFISSQKAAVVGGALYAPLYLNAFKGWFGGGTTGFIAPIVKGGLQTITAGALSATAPAPGTTTTTATVNSTGLYYFWGAGLRLGDLKLHSSWNIAPEVLSHLDLTVGQWENFKQCRNAANCMPVANGAVPSNQLYQPLLFALEGQLNIPKTPVQIGFKSITPMNGGGQGDLRFFFGVKLDIGCIYKTFKGGSTPTFFECTDDQSTTTDTNTTAPSAPSKGGGAPATATGSAASH